MRRTDTLLVVVVGALGIFVATQISRRPPAPAHSAAAPAPVAPPAPASPQGKPAEATPKPPSSRPIVRDVDGPDPRRSVAGTYFSDMAADLNGQLVRWPDRREQGLRIWVQAQSSVRDWDNLYAQVARNAFDEWGSVGLPLRFDFILDSAGSDIQLVWTDRFPPDQGHRVGSTERLNDPNGWLKSARITVAIHDSSDRMIPPAKLLGVMRHEAGHALGLGHSNDPRTLMYPTEEVTELAPADRTTVKLLYQFPPGRVR